MIRSGPAKTLTIVVVLALVAIRAGAQGRPSGAGGTSSVGAPASAKRLPPGHPDVSRTPTAAGKLPPGHPDVSGTPTAAGRLPPGHPNVDSGAPATGQLPPGHPAVDSDSSEASGQLPPGHPAVDSDSGEASGELPPGHPAVDSDSSADDAAAGADGGQQNPHPGMNQNQPQDSVEADPKLHPGTVQVTIANGTSAPVSGVEVALVKSFQSIALGNKKDSEKARTNANGQVEFKGLSVGGAYAYEVIVTQGPAEYSSGQFQLNRQAGQRVLLHVYPVTRDLNQARVAMRGLVYIQPLDDVFQFEVWFQVFNVGSVAWVPRNVSIDLPPGSKAFNTEMGAGSARFEEPEGTRTTLYGTYVPGQQNDVRFSFQVPNEHTSTASFDFPLPPHVGEFRVIVESAPGMELSARDFPPAQRSTGVRGERILVTQARGANLDNVHFEVTGLPTRGAAPWIAVFLAFGVAAGGVSTALGSTDPRRKHRQARGDLREARNKLLDELVALERARRDKRIGPETYEDTRRTLLTALARLLESGSPSSGQR